MKLSNDATQGFICWAPDLLGSTRWAIMSLSQRGIFWTLLCRQWELVELPTDFALLARLAMSERDEFLDNWTAPLSDAFKPSPNGIQNAKLERVREVQAKRRAAGSKGGSVSGAKRKANPKQTRSKEATNAEPSVSVSVSGSTSGSDSKPKKPKTTTAYASPPLSDHGLNTPEAVAAWSAWKDYRKERRLRPWVNSTVFAVLQEFEGEPERFALAITHSRRKGWQSIFEPKGTDRPSAASASKGGAPETLGDLAAANRTRKKPAKSFPPRTCPACDTSPATWETLSTDLNAAGEDVPSDVRCSACTGTIRTVVL